MRWIAPAVVTAVVFYTIHVLGITYFVTVPALEQGSLTKAAAGGAFFGLVAYAAWSLTNLAVLRDYPSSIVPIDMTWGTLATGATAVVTFLVCSRLPWSQA